ncbi:uncharacterized protein LOC143597350 [Bidens hawaiensis]|uniref:uncharacterized protein LOC143597350 n=1 Tax=Bidens hawaiensis TaxID=980011 RepID=UPI0040492D56
MACAQDFENGSNNIKLMVKNEQDVDLKVNITFGTSNGYLQTFELPSHATKKVNITFSGEKSNKVILNAGNGDCELQISQPSPVNNPPKPKDSENTPNVKDVNNAANSTTKPKDVNNSTDSPTKAKDKKEPAKSNADAPPSSTEVNTPPKSQEVNTPPKSQEANPPPKSQDVDGGSKSKDDDDQSKSEEIDDSTKSNSKDVDDGSKSTTNVNTPVSKNNFLDQLTFYSKQVTPIHGAYAAFLVALVIGGSWVLCSFIKRRTNGGVRYQELEMGPTESSNAVDVEIAEGWEQDWDDDDWDEDKAIRSPGGNNHSKTISSNGLTSRATKKDSWDADWDD